MINSYTLEENIKWDSIVKTFEHYDVYYLSGYCKPFEKHGDGEPVLIYYENKNLKAINIVMKRDISNLNELTTTLKEGENFDLSTPYGYGGFLLEGEINKENIDKLNKEYCDFCRRNNIISEFVRFHPVIKNVEQNREIYDITQLGETITIDLESKELIWSNLTSKNRNVIRKAKKSGVEIFWGRNPELYEKFIPMYNKTMDGDNATDYYYFNGEFYESILGDLKYESMIYYAEYQNKIISMAIILFHNNQMHYHLSASDFEYRNLAASNLLLYEVACWGSENGYKTFHLGGGLGSQEDGLLKFKKAFNKNSDTSFSIGKKIFDVERYNQLVKLRYQGEILNNKSDYFPQYRG